MSLSYKAGKKLIERMQEMLLKEHEKLNLTISDYDLREMATNIVEEIGDDIDYDRRAWNESSAYC